MYWNIDGIKFDRLSDFEYINPMDEMKSSIQIIFRVWVEKRRSKFISSVKLEAGEKRQVLFYISGIRIEHSNPGWEKQYFFMRKVYIRTTYLTLVADERVLDLWTHTVCKFSGLITNFGLRQSRQKHNTAFFCLDCLSPKYFFHFWECSIFANAMRSQLKAIWLSSIKKFSFDLDF